MNEITICIPTYCRRESVCTLVSSIIQQNILLIADLIVIDDGSIDDTYEELRKLNYPSGSNVCILRQENEGLAATFVKFFTLCKTEYLLMIADDDKILGSNFTKIIDFLVNTETDFVSAIWMASDGHTINRGKKYITKISLDELRAATNHAPGLIYKVESCKQALSYLKERLAATCYAANIFPQVVLSLYLSLYSDRLHWCPIAIGGYNKYGAKSSGLHDSHGNHWSSVQGRWNEQVSFEKIYSNLVDLSRSNLEKIKYSKLLAKHNSEIYVRLRSGVEVQKPDLSKLLDGGSLFYNIRNLSKSIKNLFEFVLKKYF